MFLCFSYKAGSAYFYPELVDSRTCSLAYPTPISFVRNRVVLINGVRRNRYLVNNLSKCSVVTENPFINYFFNFVN